MSIVLAVRRARKQRPGDRFCAPEEAQRANILSEMLQLKLNWLNAPARQPLLPLAAEMATLCIDGGKKRKCVREIFWAR